jgi:hypothetical protein
MEYISALFLIKNYEKNMLKELEKFLRKEYDPYWNRQESSFSNNLNISFNCRGENFDFELEIGLNEEIYNAQKKTFIELTINDLVLDPEMGGVNNRVAILLMLEDTFNFLNPIHGFGAHEILMDPIQSRILEGTIDPTKELFGVNYFGNELVQKIGPETFKNLPYGKMKRCEAGIIYAIDEYSFFDSLLYDFPKSAKVVLGTEEQYKETAKILRLNYHNEYQ